MRALIQNARKTLVSAAAVTMMFVACQADQATNPTVTAVQFKPGGGGGPGPKVNSTDPPSAEQETTLDVRVLGSGFDEGSDVAFLLDGASITTITVGSVTFVNSKELRARITIDLAADTTLYDVEVFTLRGKRGIGADLFLVVMKGDPGPPGPSDAFPTIVTFRDAATDNIRSDAELRSDTQYSGPAYEDGVCGVMADLGNFDDARMNPDARYRKGRHRKTCGDSRVLIIDRDEPADNGPALDPFVAGVFSNIDKVLLAVTPGEDELHWGQFNLFSEACGGLLFDPDNPDGAGSDLLLVSYDGADTWTVRTQDPASDGTLRDKARCTVDGRLWHMPFQMTIRWQ